MRVAIREPFSNGLLGHVTKLYEFMSEGIKGTFTPLQIKKKKQKKPGHFDIELVEKGLIGMSACKPRRNVGRMIGSLRQSSSSSSETISNAALTPTYPCKT